MNRHQERRGAAGSGERAAWLRRCARSGLLALALAGGTALPALAADHGDGPQAANDQSADVADVYFFIDPNDSTKAILIGTTRGFIVPSEAVNFSVFDHRVHYRFEIENTGDTKLDRYIDVTFNRKTSSAVGQTATITFAAYGSRTVSHTALATVSSFSPSSPTPVVTDLGNGISFFAGEADDPFFFDIPGFNRFVASVLGGAPDPTRLDRGRDSFAGYNAMAIALRVPVALIKGAGNVVGVNYATFREVRGYAAKPKSNGSDLAQVDREGNPAVNAVLVPFSRKDTYNVSTPTADASGRFAADIVGTLTALGTSQSNINLLASVAVANGDYLRLDVTRQNLGSGGGNNAGAGFPNGRRLRDDVVDTLLSIVTNGLITTGDHVDANDLAFRDTFPFLAPTQQPREGAGNVDDNTRN